MVHDGALISEAHGGELWPPSGSRMYIHTVPCVQMDDTYFTHLDTVQTTQKNAQSTYSLSLSRLRAADNTGAVMMASGRSHITQLCRI